jgi:hypothetical protein
MFNPSQEDVRRFFCEAWVKGRGQLPLSPIEMIAVDWIEQHPEYHDELIDVEAAIARDYSVEAGRTNPFLHLSMHLSIEEQISIDQPPGIREAFTRLSQRLDDRHEAMHEIMECLGQVLWQSQRTGLPIDGAAYIEMILQRASR